eukprot:1142688-Pelagomonas_calceolata.AAC.7
MPLGLRLPHGEAERSTPGAEPLLATGHTLCSCALAREQACSGARLAHDWRRGCQGLGLPSAARSWVEGGGGEHNHSRLCSLIIYGAQQVACEPPFPTPGCVCCLQARITDPAEAFAVLVLKASIEPGSWGIQQCEIHAPDAHPTREWQF